MAPQQRAAARAAADPGVAAPLPAPLTISARPRLVRGAPELGDLEPSFSMEELILLASDSDVSEAMGSPATPAFPPLEAVVDAGLITEPDPDDPSFECGASTW